MRASLLVAVIAILATAVSTAHAADRYPIADMKDLPQDASAYVGGDLDERVATEEEQRVLAADLLRRRYAPWLVPDLSYLDMTIESAAATFGSYGTRTFYTSDGKKYPAASMKKLAANARIDTKSAPRAGVIVAPCDVRVMPTSTLLATNASSARGDRGLLRLDALQVSAIKPGEPIAIWSASVDGAWLFMSSESVAGWVPTSAAAFMPDDARAVMMRADHMVAVRDTELVLPGGGSAKVKMGGLLASDGEGGVLVPRRTKSGLAELVSCAVTDGAFEPFPVPFTVRNAVRAANELVGEPYGWGGLGGYRDCSAMTRDYCAVFGAWLPRNSGDQEKHASRTDVKGLSPAQKNAAIADRAVPLRTIVHLPGHIMLYIGTRGGAPIMLHNMWGIRVDAPGGKVGRRVVGRAVITSLRAGEEIKGRSKRSLLEDNVDSFTDAFSIDGRELF